MFTGLSAFPLTPITGTGLDTAAYARLVERLAAAGVDSIGALGSTGSYAYLTRDQRAEAAKIAVGAAAGTPVMVGIGALTTSEVLALAEDAQNAGAAAVLLAPVSYQPLTDDEVFGLYEDVTRELSVPLCVYDNPRTTHFQFSDELHGRIAGLPGVGSIKIPGVPAGAKARVDALRARIPDTVTIGISGDPFAAAGLAAGCDAWYSALAGTFPDAAQAIMRDPAESERLRPLWDLFARHGGIRVLAAAATHLGLTGDRVLPRPLRELDGPAREEVIATLAALSL
ncbi:dihydrodipicolinate synthase family protein [Amycolatopsis thermalba]|uniref:Dihydrodipicolinate synthase family protein n=1 Tax=Amycolatopsis thermalba TaxID=944492 RepID=A0ABY4NY04_9PSEU|nr:MULTISPECIES: dihydrodipicolinate synthase family protein [Amycolatopsis]OXM74855.1 dihydrodipicolinate synthase family protein [Amycolatopsis sp. KNN50.9b]UQS24969.1 dihydrodipicolinate synthase family protein [Amycolatopsis thermalba]